MKERGVHTFKICNIKGVVYLQIWKKTKAHGSSEYVRSCGTADKLQETLVRYEEKEKQTKELSENLTKITKGESVAND